MSPRGGARKGAGRPKIEGEKRTTHLGGVHVTPAQIESYKRAAGECEMTLSRWVTGTLDHAVERVARAGKK